LTAEHLSQLAATPDILLLGMLADTVRKGLHGQRVTYVRVASYPAAATSAGQPVASFAREIRVTKAPASIDDAVKSVQAARAVAGERVVSGFAWADIARLAAEASVKTSNVLDSLHASGLDAVAHVPLDKLEDPAEALDRLASAGFRHIRLTIDKAPADQRTQLMVRAAELQAEFACIRALSPLPTSLDALRPTTGYDDVKTMAIARLAAPNISSMQVDWLRYGPKLAQVALTFGADDIDNASAHDDAPDGLRRAPMAELRRNIEAAGFHPAERDGRFETVD